MATATLEKPSSPAWYHLTSSQTFWVMAQAGLLIGATAFQFLTNREQMELFWRDALGFKLSLLACLMTFANFLVLVGGCFYLNRLSVSRWEARPVLLKTCTMGLYTVCFVCLYLPTLFVIMIGPASVTIQRELLI